MEHLLQFTVQARDRFENDRSSGGDVFHIFLQGPSARSTVTDHNDGTYGITIHAQVTGKYRIHVKQDKTAIRGSPFTVTMVEGCPCTLHAS